MSVRMLSIFLSLLFFCFIIDLIRREKLTFKYALSWLVACIAVFLFVIFDKCLYQISTLLGFELVSNFIFFSAMCGFVFLSLLLTIFLCQQSSHNDRMAQKLGILECEIEELKKKEN